MRITVLVILLAVLGCSPASIKSPAKKPVTVLWKFQTGDQVFSPTSGTGGTLYVGSNDNKVYAIRTDSKGLAKSARPMHGQNAQHTGRAAAVVTEAELKPESVTGGKKAQSTPETEPAVPQSRPNETAP